MLYIVKLLFYLVRELVFDNKDEYDIKSAKFNTRKFMVLIVVVMTILSNCWLFYRLVTVTLQYREDLKYCTVQTEAHREAEIKAGIDPDHVYKEKKN